MEFSEELDGFLVRNGPSNPGPDHLAGPDPTIHFFFINLFALIHLVQSKLSLYPSYYKALLLIQKDLDFHGQRRSRCHSAGIFCEWRFTNNSYVLKVTRLVFESQNLTGIISTVVGKLSELKELSLQNNELFGQIPTEIFQRQRLEMFNIRKNQFSGEVPEGLSSLIRLRVLDISSNKFSGSLKFLNNFPNLEKLNLADNMFAGKLPLSLRSFRNLRFINISGNTLLEGPLLVINQLEHLSSENIQNRYILAEKSMERNLTSARAMAPSSSKGLNGIHAEASSPTATTKHKHKKTKRKILCQVIGLLVGTFAGIPSGSVLYFLLKFITFLIEGQKMDRSLAIFSMLIKNPKDLAFLGREDGWNGLNVIGRGGCGEVYKSTLPGTNGKEIAIKKIIQPSRDAEELAEEDSKHLNKKMRQIRSEIQTSSQIRHRNLLPLLAHLSRPDCHYLVYEYMKNGSLQDVLEAVSKGRRELDWLARYKVAIGVASGLEYLHLNQTPSIIHRDLKPANILLDDEMEAQITDFGLAKAMPEANTHVTTSNVAGTVGYIAPEYYQTSQFTEKCDIYSFGIVLGVLAMGKFPWDDFFQHTDEMTLVGWMRNVMTSDDPKRSINPRLLGNGYEEQILLVLKIACYCTLDNPKEWPDSKEVRCMLTQI
ncbi:leucine-rich repeat receptor-like serine/threonine/tyrosine-protein kinase SOBIR1 [Olea europaea var. sylvestris]|uniref:leucine-rich repeat receptor-like serine/threonine/tyrosine-protein kinase SOBIR1 n=1 Tax=Olea europaea var. sylvestris TaxID=158386 RepID=UPI000C1CE670|nr:leucine-rich repeat receptor-like serine/threonine/tyrosine-protein kinase SOBIR1 [Olea europaea var. sylvestris]